MLNVFAICRVLPLRQSPVLPILRVRKKAPSVIQCGPARIIRERLLHRHNINTSCNAYAARCHHVKKNTKVRCLELIILPELHHRARFMVPRVTVNAAALACIAFVLTNVWEDALFNMQKSFADL